MSARDLDMYNKASGMAETLLIDVFSQFQKFLKKRDKENYNVPLIIKRESHTSNSNNSVIFPSSLPNGEEERIQRKENDLAFERAPKHPRMANKKQGKKRRRNKRSANLRKRNIMPQ